MAPQHHAGGGDAQGKAFPAHDLTVRYVVGLSAIALLVIAGQALVQHHLDLQVTDARTINVAGRQRMLSQRIAQLSLRARHADGLAQRRELLSELSETADLWRRSHAALQEGDPELGVPGDNSATVTRLFADLEVDFRAIDGALRGIEEHGAGADPAAFEPFIASILVHAEPFLHAMNEIVFTYDGEASARVASLRQVEIGLAVAALLVLLLEALFIFRPAAARIRRIFAQLVTARARYEELSQRDGLTGIANRRCFDDMFDREFRRAVRDSKPLSVILVDVDHFKQYNDEFGHQRGDECIRRIAAALEQSARRPADLVARYGGDEFVAVLPDTHLVGAQQVAEAMKASVRGLAIKRQTPRPYEMITVTLGVATTVPHRSVGSAADLLGAADDALLRAKEVERDSIIGVELPSSPPPRPRRRTHPEADTLG